MSRAQNFQIFVYLMNILVCGFIFSVLGPSLPDLQCVYRADLKSLSLLFLFFGLGGVLARSVSGLIYTRVSSPHVLLLLCSLVHCAACSLLPFSPTVALASALICAQGCSNGLAISGILCIIMSTWPGNGRLIHLMFTCSSVGSTLGPLILTPFLSDGYLTRLYRTNFHVNWTANNTGIVSALENTTSHCHPTDGFVTLIQYPFLIIGCLHIPVICGYLTMLLYKNKIEACTEKKVVSEKRNVMEATALYIVGMFLFQLQGQGVPSSFSGFMTAYGMDSLHISLQTMSLMTSLFWATFTVTRFSLSFLPADCDQLFIICTSIAGSSIGISVLIRTLSGKEASLWVSSLILAMSTSPMISTLMNWGVQTVDVTPNINALFLVANISGSALPYVCGYVMDMLGSRLFVIYFVVFHMFNCFIFSFLIIYIHFKM